MTPYERLDLALSEQSKWVKVLEDNGCRVELAKPGRELDAQVVLDGFDFDHVSDRKYIARVALQCRAYAKAPIIRDRFGAQHLKRREWVSALMSQYGGSFVEFYGLNKLRANSISGLTGHLYAFTSILDTFHVQSQQANAIRILFKQIPNEEIKNYIYLSDTEKVIIARKLDTIARQFLKIVTGQV